MRTMRLCLFGPPLDLSVSFAQIIEPIHNALSEEFVVPSDAIKIETGNSIANSGVTVSLLSGNVVFEARLDGYKAHFLNLRHPEDFDFAERCTKSFENAVTDFLSDGKAALCRMITSSWLNLEVWYEFCGRTSRKLNINRWKSGPLSNQLYEDYNPRKIRLFEYG